MKKYLTLVFVAVMAYPFILFADEWSDGQIREVMGDIDSIRTHTGGNPDLNPVLKQLQQDAAARAEDDRLAREAAAKALDGVSDAEKNAIAKAEKDRKAAEKAAKDNPYVIETPPGTVMPDDALATYKDNKVAAKKAHDDSRVTELSNAKKTAAARLTTRSQAMQNSAAAREDAYKAAIKANPPARPAPKFYN